MLNMGYVKDVVCMAKTDGLKTMVGRDMNVHILELGKFMWKQAWETSE